MSSRRLADKILALVARGPDGDPSEFDDLALEVFSHQYANNAPYRAFCGAAGVSPEAVTSWRDIPSYPTDAFKKDIVASFPVDEAVQANMTSGTTSANQRGRIFRDELGQELIYTANRVMTGAYLFPDFGEGQRCRILILAPSPEVAPTMGMAIGMDQTREHFGTPDSAFMVKRSGVDVKSLVAALRQSERDGIPVALIGATSAYVYFFNACRKKGMSFRLPEGSRIGDGGGYRGRFGVVTREDYYELCEEVLGVPSSHCVNILGMAESATNYADDVLRNHWLGKTGERHMPTPPWTRVAAMSPDTGKPLPPGEVGLLAHWDLVNLPTVIGVQSDNLGYMDDRGGFVIIGRAKVVDGKVSELPSEKTVGPMGDKAVFRLLEAYVNFSIEFKMGRVTDQDEKSTWEGLREEAERSKGSDAEVIASCPTVVEEMVAGADDPEARERADRALEVLAGETDVEDDD